jgi:hypothetical protein
MKSKTSIKLPLSPEEKLRLRGNKLKIDELAGLAPDEIAVLLNCTSQRAKEILALAEFQSMPSVGIRFAEDLVSMGYFTINELKGKDGAELTNEFEMLKGCRIDPCVEDQFRLVVHFAEHKDHSKNWWDFTNERKKYRQQNGYPSTRPPK